ncbi:hypothetical protein OF385_15135 [Glutamicibacter sp. JL.03c]|uniref:hypothetical protein n=1 Tax=Glutamicibacter sp. JL.03c TaxID=2984842 RepID=UPI0021F7DF85|nr:hypothetical protein [Glutamicibacter sp. JL.03c]UYQ77333.1 hypothetical protein OF385_15135 [Glutamicibacter sp. JL.03c]
MAPSSRSARALRGTSAALFATFVSLASHMLAGGPVPSLLNIALPLSLSLLVCMLLSGKQFTLLRLAVMVGFSQLLFHFLFSMGSGSSVAAASGPHLHHGTPLNLDVTSVAHHAAASHGESTMVLAHLGAALATVLVLHRSEQVLIGISSIVDVLTWKFVLALVNYVFHPFTPRVAAVESRDIPAATLAVDTTSVIRRGPPAFTTA